LLKHLYHLTFLTNISLITLGILSYLITPLLHTIAAMIGVCCVNNFLQTISGMEVEFGLKINKSIFLHWFSEKVNNLIINGNMFGDKLSNNNSFLHKIVV
jgi:hypothetical protein